MRYTIVMSPQQIDEVDVTITLTMKAREWRNVVVTLDTGSYRSQAAAVERAIKEALAKLDTQLFGHPSGAEGEA